MISKAMDWKDHISVLSCASFSALLETSGFQTWKGYLKNGNCTHLFQIQSVLQDIFI